MESLFDDLRAAVRSLVRAKGTTVFAILVLAVGVGANSAMFSLVNTLVLRPLAAPNPEELSLILRHDVERQSWDSFSYAELQNLRAGTETFRNITGHTLAMVAIGEGSNARRSFADVVASDYFSTFGVQLALGRAFDLNEERPEATLPVAILGYDAWQRSGGTKEILETELTVNGTRYDIVGVAPRGFAGTSALVAHEIYLPLGMAHKLSDSIDADSARSLADPTNRQLLLVGRRAQGNSEAVANADLERVSSNLQAGLLSAEDRAVRYEAHQPSRLSISNSPQQDDELVILAGLLLSMSLIVLIVAGFNLAAVQDARNLARRRELGVRLALGSGRGRVLRKLVLESGVLALAGSALGLVFAFIAPRLLGASLASAIPFEILLDGQLDLRVLGATIGFATVAALLVGAVPALRATRRDLSSDLKQHTGDTAERRGRLGLSRGDVPVFVQLALSTVLLFCAGLFTMSAVRGAAVDPGFRVDQHVLLEVDPAMAGYEPERISRLQLELKEELATLPGIESVAYANTTPFGMTSFAVSVADADQPSSSEEQRTIGAALRTVSDGYFETLGIEKMAGRDFRSVESRPVVIIDSRLARRMFGDEQPLGRRVTIPNSDRLSGPAEVIGVVENTRDSLFDREASHLFLPASRAPVLNTQIHLATKRAPTAELLSSIQEALRRVDPELPVLTLAGFDAVLDRNIEVWMLRAGAKLFGAFALLALFLAAAGVYGVQAYRVARRTREVGLRMALGATVKRAVRDILGRSLQVAVLACLVGAAAAIAAGRLLQTFLVEIRAIEPSVLVLSCLALLASAGVASLIPALRAARVDPLSALRSE